MFRMTSWGVAIPALALSAAVALAAAGAETSPAVASATPSLQPDVRLPEAVKRGDVAEVEALLRAHVPVNSAEGDGSTALHWAAYDNNLELARILLKARADVNAKTRLEGMTPLYMACQNGSAPMIELLLANGANANGANSMGTTPLMEAAASGSAPAVEALLAHGAEVNTGEHVRNQTALMFAADEGRADVIRVLDRAWRRPQPGIQGRGSVPAAVPWVGQCSEGQESAGGEGSPGGKGILGSGGNVICGSGTGDDKRFGRFGQEEARTYVPRVQRQAGGRHVAAALHGAGGQYRRGRSFNRRRREHQ